MERVENENSTSIALERFFNSFLTFCELVFIFRGHTQNPCPGLLSALSTGSHDPFLVGLPASSLAGQPFWNLCKSLISSTFAA
jgi:hypothetical protein